MILPHLVEVRKREVFLCSVLFPNKKKYFIYNDMNELHAFIRDRIFFSLFIRLLLCSVQRAQERAERFVCYKLLGIEAILNKFRTCDADTNTWLEACDAPEPTYSLHACIQSH